MRKTKEERNSSMRRIKYLFLLQTGDKWRAIRQGNKKALAFRYFLGTLGVAAITAGLIFLLRYVKNTYQFNLSANLLTTVLFVTQLFGIVSCTASMMSVLYLSRENNMLLAFPCHYNEIFVSKILVFSVEEFKKSFFFVLPFLVAFGIAATPGVAYWVLVVPAWLMLCLLPVLLGATLSIGAIYVKRFLDKHIWLYALVVAAALIGVFVLLVHILSLITPPLKLVTTYVQFLASLERAFAAVNKFALWYNFFGRMLFGTKVWLYLPLNLVIFAGLGALCFLVAMPFYFKAASSTAESARNKGHKVRKAKKHGLFATFLRKEFTLMFRTPKEVNSALSVILIFPMITYILNIIITAINTNLYGNYMTVAFNVMIILSLLGTHNANCAQALSSEGSEFAVLKAAPSNMMTMTWAKLTVTSIVNLIAVVVSIVLIRIPFRFSNGLALSTSLSATELVLMTLLIVLFSIGHIFWSFELDIRNPKIADYITQGDAVVDNPNVAKAIVMGFVTATLVGVITLLLLIDNYTTGWVRILIIAAAFLAARIYLYRSNLKSYFDEIQA